MSNNSQPGRIVPLEAPDDLDEGRLYAMKEKTKKKIGSAMERKVERIRSRSLSDCDFDSRSRSDSSSSDSSVEGKVRLTKAEKKELKAAKERARVRRVNGDDCDTDDEMGCFRE